MTTGSAASRDEGGRGVPLIRNLVQEEGNSNSPSFECGGRGGVGLDPTKTRRVGVRYAATGPPPLVYHSQDKVGANREGARGGAARTGG